MKVKPNKRIALTIGDPAGIGPEITLKAVKMLADSGRFEYSNFLIIGDRELISRACGYFNCPGLIEKLNILHVESDGARKIKTGIPSAYSGLASFEYIK
ncbi:MAG TPA: 4-hydroxythreonine-4-phosphate dehydrogenase, partial [Candidatus Wallbacteria bacterium]|nr:4-hydroxythreonine-4-phosphate dehydrogenase [Candidatus Wallbacteria bacterium]